MSASGARDARPRDGRPAVFLDRDGTIADELGYLADPARLVLLPGAAAAVARLNAAGLPVVLVTNQSGVARGLLDEAALERVHRRLAELLAAEGGHLDLVLSATWHPDFPRAADRPRADWRKPEAGMLREAARRLDLDLARSFVVGDAARDLEAGRRAGVPHLILVETGKGRAAAGALDPDLRARVVVLPDLAAAVDRILAGTSGGADPGAAPRAQGR